MSIGQAIASSGGLKLATGGLAAALALGGGAMATGNLACEIAPAAGVQGNLLVETGLDASADARVEQRTIEVEGLGLVDVAHSDVVVEVVGIQLRDDATAEVRSENEGGAEIHFTLDGLTRTLLVSVVDGELFASLAPSVSAVGAVTGAAEVEADARADEALGIDLDVDADSEGAVDASGRIDISSDLDADGGFDISSDLDGDGGFDISSDLDADGDVGILGGLGIDAKIDN